MDFLPQIVFLVITATAFIHFGRNMYRVRKNILLGRDTEITGSRTTRIKNLLLMAFGQKKMFRKPLVAVMHMSIFLGFFIINLELIEFTIDGLAGTHRILLHVMGTAYTTFISMFELLAVAVIASCLIFLMRRNVYRLGRFRKNEMTLKHRTEASIYLMGVMFLMFCILIMNIADLSLQQAGHEKYLHTGTFLVSGILMPWFSLFSESQLVILERFGWWGHYLGVLSLLVYIPYTKQLHIILAFPNTWYMKQESQGKMRNMPEVAQEVKLMMDPSAEPADIDGEISNFGAKDAHDLNWKQLLDAYACTECGRCTEACPANITGKLLSPRKIMMDTRKRIAEIGKNKSKHGIGYDDNKKLLGDYISEEELWACTSCNACVEECPVGIDPLSIILEMRRNLVMEESKASPELVNMFNNLENNGAPWQFSPEDRTKWINE